MIAREDHVASSPVQVPLRGVVRSYDVAKARTVLLVQAPNTGRQSR